MYLQKHGKVSKSLYIVHGHVVVQAFRFRPCARVRRVVLSPNPMYHSTSKRFELKLKSSDLTALEFTTQPYRAECRYIKKHTHPQHAEFRDH